MGNRQLIEHLLSVGCPIHIVRGIALNIEKRLMRSKSQVTQHKAETTGPVADEFAKMLDILGTL